MVACVREKCVHPSPGCEFFENLHGEGFGHWVKEP